MNFHKYILVVLLFLSLITGVYAANNITVDFTSNVTTGNVPLPVQFINSGTNDSGWAWLFGDEEYKQPWILQNTSPGINLSYHSSTTRLDGTLITLDAPGNGSVWGSTDNGITWSLVSNGSGWSIYSGMNVVSLPNGNLIAMSTDGGVNSIWASTDNGLTWTQTNANTGFITGGIYGGESLQLISTPDNSLIMIGEKYRAVRKSIDNGATWTSLSTGSWIGRAGTSIISTHINGTIILTGGISVITFSPFNDTWVTNDSGVTWIQVNSSSGWTPRAAHEMFIMPDNAIILTGGSVFSSSYFNDMWRSIDNGTIWTRINTSSSWTPRNSFTTVPLYDGGVILLGGSNATSGNSDIWRFQSILSNVEDSIHTYSNVGTFNVTLQSSNVFGVNRTTKYGYITTVNTNIAPSTAFNITPNPGTVSQSIIFVDMSVNGPTSWNWSFGDGFFSNSQNATHVYNVSGTYPVILNASNAFGFSNFSINVSIYPLAPVASFGVDHNIGTAPLTVQFTDTSTGCISAWYWDFGDGNTSTIQNPSHTYNYLGTFNTRVTVTSFVGDNTSSPPVPIYVIASPIPIVDFTGSPLSGSSPLSVQFTDLSVALNGVTAWNWSFGDGNFSNSQNPTYIYGSNGQYSVTLVATEIGGTSNFSSKIGYINVGVSANSVTANFIANTTFSPTFPVDILFSDTSICNPVCTNWAWDFNNDGQIESLQQNPVFTFTAAGNYSPKLLVSNGINTGSVMKVNYITIGPIFVPTTIPQPTGGWHPGYQANGSVFAFKGNTNIDLPNSTFLKYWLQNFSATGNFSIYGFTTGLMAPLMHVFGFWIFLMIWGLYLFAVWIRTQDVTMPLIIGILTIGTFGLLFPKESLPVIIIMFVICGAIIVTKLMKDNI